jgi:uncharacterized low-complexity protein
MPVQFGLAMLALAGPAQAGAAPGGSSPYFGRWTVAEDRPVFTARGRLYKTIDVAQCGKDFCGVSVADNGKCGAVLFRFFGWRAKGSEELRGHGKWGADQKNIVIYDTSDPSDAGSSGLELYLGDGHDFGERSENMPKFHAEYRRLGKASCVAR